MSRSFLILWCPIYSSFPLVAELLGFYWGSLCLYLFVPVFPAPSCTNFRVSGLIFRSLIHFELRLVQHDRHGSRFSSLQTGNHFSQSPQFFKLNTKRKTVKLQYKSLTVTILTKWKQSYITSVSTTQNQVALHQIEKDMERLVIS
jgi:hypothetical protein